MLVVSSVIGVGIFLTPGSVASALPSTQAFLAAWALGGLLSVVGALANAELGAMYPHAGGDYVYLREAWHPLAGFVVGWLTFFVIYAGTVATLAIGFAEGLGQSLSLDANARTGLAVVTTVLVSAINYRGVRLGALLNNTTAGFKIVALLALAIVGPMLGNAPVHPVTAPASEGATWSGFALAMPAVLFSYLGWNASIYVASEIKKPERNLPLSLFVGIAVCTGIYLLVNLAYVHALSIDGMRGEIHVGEAAARVFFGNGGAALASVLILVSVASCLNATILVGPRIAYAMAIDGLFFGAAASVHAKYNTPHWAIVLQAITAVTLIVLLRRFPSVLDYTTFAILLAAMADVAALYVLRRKQPHRTRPYRAWGYPVVPALYFVANGAIAAAMLWNRPLECAAALAVAATALPAYAYFTKRGSTSCT